MPQFPRLQNGVVRIKCDSVCPVFGDSREWVSGTQVGSERQLWLLILRVGFSFG